MRISPLQRQALIEATIDDLRPFRRGYARSKAGPFFEVRTVSKLVKTGALRFVGRRLHRLSARVS